MHGMAGHGMAMGLGLVWLGRYLGREGDGREEREEKSLVVFLVVMLG